MLEDFVREFDGKGERGDTAEGESEQMCAPCTPNKNAMFHECGDFLGIPMDK